jgi:hypothetical protein
MILRSGLMSSHVPAQYLDHAGVRYVPILILPSLELMSRLDRSPLPDPLENFISPHFFLAHDYTDVDCIIMLYACILPIVPLQGGSTHHVTRLSDLCRNRSFTLILILILMTDEPTAIHHKQIVTIRHLATKDLQE